MGISSSREYYKENDEKLVSKAAENYRKRINAYNYAYHGNYYDYVEYCQGKFQIECLPDYCTRGSHFTR